MNERDAEGQGSEGAQQRRTTMGVAAEDEGRAQDDMSRPLAASASSA